MLRVDHAGECAAVRIYEGQRAVLGHTAEGPQLAEMATHERAHLERFQRLVWRVLRSARRGSGVAPARLRRGSGGAQHRA